MSDDIQTRVILFAMLGGALLAAIGYVVERAAWPEHDPVALLLSLWY
jgi:hypothetical protein